MAERIGWVDFAKGVAIILMVLGHATTTSPLQNFIYVFHMPFFFVTAGFLLNLRKWGGVGSYITFASKLVKRLLLPYFLAEFLWYPFFVVKEHYFGHMLIIMFYSTPADMFWGIFMGKPTTLPLSPLWFLLTLFVAEIIFIKLYNRLNEVGAEVFVLAVAMCSLLGLCVGKVGALPFGTDIALAAQIFILAGVLIRRYNFVERIDLKTCAALTLILAAAFSLNGRVEMSGAIYGEPFLFYAGALSGTLLLMKLSALTTGGKIFSLISSCGRQSMMILVLHSLTIEFAYNLLV